VIQYNSQNISGTKQGLSSKKSTIKKRFPITSNLRYMYRVLNVDEIKN
jgi:hypothetical protein